MLLEALLAPWFARRFHVIALEQTAAHLRRAAKVDQEVARGGGIVLFVGTREGQDRAVSRAEQFA